MHKNQIDNNQTESKTISKQIIFNDLKFESEKQNNIKSEIKYNFKNTNLATETIKNALIDIFPKEKNNYCKETQTNNDEFNIEDSNFEDTRYCKSNIFLYT